MSIAEKCWEHYEELGRRVRLLRTNKGLSIEVLACLTGMSATTISEIERGIRQVSTEGLIRLCIGLQCNLEEIVSPDVMQPVFDMVRHQRDIGEIFDI